MCSFSIDGNHCRPTYIVYISNNVTLLPSNPPPFPWAPWLVESRSVEAAGAEVQLSFCPGDDINLVCIACTFGAWGTENFIDSA